MAEHKLTPGTEILFTRQIHDAHRAGRHYDIRLVVGDKAYSWATRKDIPGVGKSIVLFEQPVHTAHYALSDNITIPEGSYGAGTTKLDFVRKATIGEHSTQDQMTLHTKSGEKYLLKRLPDGKFGDNAWLFRNLGMTGNKYLEKTSSLIGGVIATHLLQNIGTNTALKSKHIAKYLANSFSEGAHGVVNTSLKSKFARTALGAGLPDIAVAHKTLHELGGALSHSLKKATPRQKVGLRLLTEGKFDKLKKYNFHHDELVKEVHGHLQKHLGFPSLDDITSKSHDLGKLWNDKSHPLLSNISTHLSHGHVPEGKNFVEGKLTAKPIMGGALGSFAVDPAAGTLNTAKSLMASKAITGTKYGKKVTEMLQKQFVTNPIKSGVDSAGEISKLKNTAYKFGVNPLSAHLKRTSAALTDVLKD